MKLASNRLMRNSFTKILFAVGALALCSLLLSISCSKDVASDGEESPIMIPTGR